MTTYTKLNTWWFLKNSWSTLSPYLPPSPWNSTWHFLDSFQSPQNQNIKHFPHYFPFHRCFLLRPKASTYLCNILTNPSMQIKFQSHCQPSISSNLLHSFNLLTTTWFIFCLYYHCLSSSSHHLLTHRSAITLNHNMAKILDHWRVSIQEFPN